MRRARASVCTRVLVYLSSDVCQTCVSQQLRGSSQALPFLWFFSLLACKNNRTNKQADRAIRCTCCNAQAEFTHALGPPSSTRACSLSQPCCFNLHLHPQLLFLSHYATHSFPLFSRSRNAVTSRLSKKWFLCGADRKQHRRITICICLLRLVLHLCVCACVRAYQRGLVHVDEQVQLRNVCQCVNYPRGPHHWRHQE